MGLNSVSVKARTMPGKRRASDGYIWQCKNLKSFFQAYPVVHVNKLVSNSPMDVTRTTEKVERSDDLRAIRKRECVEF